MRNQDERSIVVQLVACAQTFVGRTGQLWQVYSSQEIQEGRTEGLSWDDYLYTLHQYWEDWTALFKTRVYRLWHVWSSKFYFLLNRWLASNCFLLTKGRYRESWSFFYTEVDGIFFVVDASDYERLSVAQEVLQEMARHPCLHGRELPFVIISNKQDLREKVDDL